MKLGDGGARTAVAGGVSVQRPAGLSALAVGWRCGARLGPVDRRHRRVSCREAGRLHGEA
jgi:hypothetical protein